MAKTNQAPAVIDTFDEALADFLYRLVIPGFGYGKARTLVADFGSLENIREATWPLLSLSRGVSVVVARGIDNRLQRLSVAELAHYERLVDQYKPLWQICPTIMEKICTWRVLRTSLKIFSGPTAWRLNEGTPQLSEFLDLMERIRAMPLGTSSAFTRREHQLLKDFYLVPENVVTMERLKAFVRKHGK